MKLFKNKKTMMVICLLLLMVVGLTSYGVYSYYWTQGSFTGTDTITIASFNPQTYIQNDEFLGDGGVLSLSCTDTSNDENHYYGSSNSNNCSGSLTITNNGSTNIVVTVSDASADYKFHEPADESYDGVADSMVINSVSSPEFNWTSKTIAPGQSETLELDVDVSFYINGFDSYNSGYQVNNEMSSSAIGGSYFSYYQIYASFKLKAEQAH